MKTEKMSEKYNDRNEKLTEEEKYDWYERNISQRERKRNREKIRNEEKVTHAYK